MESVPVHTGLVGDLMEVLQLNRTTYQPEKLIENYETMIWTERYLPAGDFKLVTADINRTRQLCPIGSFITLLDTREVMQVETSLIAPTDEGDKLTMTGRTLDAINESRVSAYAPGTPGPAIPGLPSTRADVQGRVQQQLFRAGWGAIANLSVNDRLPNTEVVITMPRGPVVVYPETAVQTADDIRALMEPEDWGLRIKRPALNGTKIGIEIYAGVNRTASIVLQAERGDLNNPSFLQAIKDLKNVAYVWSPLGYWETYIRGTSATSGWDRRALFVNASDITEVPAGTVWQTLLQARGEAELKKYNQTVWVDGGVSAFGPYKYKVDYDLGDLVTLDTSTYGYRNTLRVAEYVRTQDVTGETGYPTLVAA